MNNIDKKIEPTLGVGSDIPQTDPDLDEFGYADFAKLIAAAVTNTPSPQGLVMAIHGPWGTGKSTLLNFVKHYLRTREVSSKPIVIEFNPWWFEDRGQLAAQFLAQFSTQLSLGPSKIRNLGNLMAEYSGALGKTVALSTGYPWIDKLIGIVLKCFKLKPKDVPKLKKEIGDALRSGSQRYVFIIDDIDRLTPDEIREVFKVVKALADFPNVVYLLSFDRSVVAKALNSALGLDGEAYLEKIIQAPFELPYVSPDKLHRKLFSDLDKLLEGTDLSLFDQYHWGNIFNEGMALLITKPRDIVRYVNALSVTFPVLRNEVNVADFFALELLRVHLPSLYTVLRENPDKFSGRAEHGLESIQRQEEHAFHQVWIMALDEKIRPGIRSMLERIFPRLDNIGRGAEFNGIWRKERRAAATEVFSVYFAFGIQSDRLSRQAIIAFIDDLTVPERATSILLSLVHTKRLDGSIVAMEYLSHLKDFDKELDAAKASNLLITIDKIADLLLLNSSGQDSVTMMPISWSISFIVQFALSKIHKEERNAALISAFSDPASVGYLSFLVSWLVRAHENPSEHGPAAVLSTITAATVDTLRQLALANIRGRAAANTLLTTPQLSSVLYRWREWSDPEESRQWASQLINDRNSLVQLVTAFLNQTRSNTIGDSVWGVHHFMQFKNLADFVDLEQTSVYLSGVENIKTLTERQQLALNTFKQQYHLFKQGKNPEDPVYDEE